MATCLISNGRAIDCRNQIGGVRKVYLMNYDAALADGITQDVDGTITDYPVTTVYEHDVVRNTTGYNETIQSVLENGTTFYDGALTLVLLGNTQERNNELQAIVASTPHAVLEMNDGQFLQIGLKNGLFSTGTLEWGLAMGDRVGAALNMQCNEQVPAFYVADFLGIANITIMTET